MGEGRRYLGSTEKTTVIQPFLRDHQRSANKKKKGSEQSRRKRGEEESSSRCLTRMDQEREKSQNRKVIRKEHKFKFFGCRRRKGLANE